MDWVAAEGRRRPVWKETKVSTGPEGWSPALRVRISKVSGARPQGKILESENANGPLSLATKSFARPDFWPLPFTRGLVGPSHGEPWAKDTSMCGSLNSKYEGPDKDPPIKDPQARPISSGIVVSDPS